LERNTASWHSGHGACAAQGFGVGYRIPLQPGNYTAVLSGKNNTTGVGLVEVYDIEKSVSSALTNVSTQGFVGTDQNVLIGGFIISGTGPKKLVVRALGPTLSSFGVPGYPPTVSKQADLFADAVINSRPLPSTSALSTIRVTPPGGSHPNPSLATRTNTAIKQRQQNGMMPAAKSCSQKSSIWLRREAATSAFLLPGSRWIKTEMSYLR
jgi:hypothetical protein